MVEIKTSSLSNCDDLSKYRNCVTRAKVNCDAIFKMAATTVPPL